MDLFNLLIRGLDTLASALADLLRRQVIDPILGDSSYRSGFVCGLLVALVIGFISQQLLFWWNRILQFFAPTETPATAPGPSPASTVGGCFIAVVLLIVVGGVLAAVLVRVLFPSG